MIILYMKKISKSLYDIIKKNKLIKNLFKMLKFYLMKIINLDKYYYSMKELLN